MRVRISLFRKNRAYLNVTRLKETGCLKKLKDIENTMQKEMDRWSKVLGDAGMESRTQMKGLDLKMSRSYSSEKRERE